MSAMFKYALSCFSFFVVFYSNAMEKYNPPLSSRDDDPSLPVLSSRIQSVEQLITKYHGKQTVNSLVCPSAAATYKNLVSYICMQQKNHLKTDFLLYYARQAETIRLKPFLDCKQWQLNALTRLGWSKEQIDNFSLDDWKRAYTTVPDIKTCADLDKITRYPIALKIVLAINPNIQTTEEKSSLLHIIAARANYMIPSDKRNYRLFKYILAQENINPNIQNIHGNTPLHLVTRNNNALHYTRCLLRHHAINPQQRNFANNTALDRSKINGAQTAVRLLESHTDKITFLAELIKSYNSTTDLPSLKLYNSLPKTYKNLVSYICNQKDPLLKTDFLLYYAHQEGYLKKEPFLLCRESQQEALALLGWNREWPSLKLWRIMYMKLPTGQTFDYIHTIMDNPIALRILAAVAPNTQDLIMSHSILHCMVQNYPEPNQSPEQYELEETKKYNLFCAILQQKNCNPNIRDSFGNTPLHYLCRYKRGMRYVQELLKHPKIERFATNSFGATPLDWARENGLYDIVRMLQNC